MLSSTVAHRLLNQISFNGVRAFSSSAAAQTRSLFSTLLGSQSGARGAAAATDVAPFATTSPVEAFLSQGANGNNSNAKNLAVDYAAKSLSKTVRAQYPNTFETVLGKKL